MAWSDVASAVTTIGNLLTQEGINLWGVEEQVGRLKTELKWMQSFLIEADAKQAEDERTRLWVAEIRDLAYDAEDVVETFALKIGSKRKPGFSNCIKRSACILKEGWMLHKTRSDVEKIIAKITDLIRRLQAYGIKELRDGEGSSSSTERRESRRSYPHIMDDNIVGLDADIKKLVSVLVDEESHCRVVSISGMGGLGKTTLAKKIYRHSQVIGHFNRLAWVYVSQQCQKRNVWEDILSKLTSIDERGSKQSDDELAEKLFKFLEDEKCLVILDDIWSIQAWDSLKPAFPIARDSSSKILLTTRNKEIVSYADRKGYLYELQCLKDEESWELFQKTAFPQTDSPEDKVDAKMKELGEDMVKHCAGLPLAIIVLGGILATKNNSLNDWIKVSANVKSYLKSGKGQGPEDVLALSYDDLPPYLRPCFLYLSHFPEDYEIPVDRLIQLWVAEGIVLSKHEVDGGEIAEDVAEGYLIELVERCMIQVRERHVATLKIKTFQMHDLMRDLCLSKAKQENFLFIVDQSNASSLSTIQSVRRVSAHEFFWIQCIKSPNLRSLVFVDMFISEEAIIKSMPQTIQNYIDNLEHDEHCNPLGFIVLRFLFLCFAIHKIQGIWTYMFNNFKLLRVLNHKAESSAIEASKLPNDIGNLIHLRFLSLKGNMFLWSKLPSSLGNLRCLQTLDLRVNGTVRVPNVIWRMEQLRHLYLPEECYHKTKLKLGTLRNLQTLVNFNTKSCYVEDLINMTNIRELEIRGPFNIEDFEEDLAKNPPIIKSKYLHSLSILNHDEAIDPRHLAHLLSSCVSICKLSLGVEISKLPEYHYFSNIAYIHLRGCLLKEDAMPTLEKIPNLRILELHVLAFNGKEIFCSAQCFPKLDSLSLCDLLYLEEWKVDEGAMPSLRQLEIQSCRRLKMVPEGLRFITTLQELQIELMPKAFKDKVVEGGEDFYKVQHVPSIIFRECN